MAASDIKIATQSRAAFTISLSALSNGSARQSTLLTNTSPGYTAALIYLGIKSGGTGPTATTTYDVYLIRGDGTAADDAAGASDAAITIENAPLLGSIVVTATANKMFYGVFDTSPLGPLGPSWGIAVKNNSGQALATDSNEGSTPEGVFKKGYVYYNLQAQ